MLPPLRHSGCGGGLFTVNFRRGKSWSCQRKLLTLQTDNNKNVARKTAFLEKKLVVCNNICIFVAQRVYKQYNRAQQERQYKMTEAMKYEYEQYMRKDL
jgi:hypothetical protein